MNKHMPLTNEDGEVRELTAHDIAQFRPAHEVLPVALQEKLGMRRRGPQKTPIKEVTTIRLDADIMRSLRQAGAGWQTRVNAVLREAVEQVIIKKLSKTIRIKYVKIKR